MPEKKKEYFDIKYVIRFQKGDQAAFDYIFNYYKNHIYWTGINFFSNEEKAKDLVQMVFLEIYETIGKLKEPSKFTTWMNRIAYNRCLQMLRYDMKDSLHYSNNMGDTFVDTFIEDEKIDSPINYVQKEQIKEIIIKEIEELSPQYRTICYLRFFEELSYAEISDITAVPLGTITNYIGRLKPKLQGALKKHGFTSASCLSLIIVPNMIEYFKVFIDIRKPLSNDQSKEILQEVKESNKQQHKSKSMKAYGYMALSFILTVGIVIALKEDLPSIYVNKEKEAIIQKIYYPKQLTNAPFKVQVETSNKNYDEILLNDKGDLTVHGNGEYKISIVKNGTEIDNKTISITNIDRDIPIVTKEQFEQGVMTLSIDDKDSEIDFEQIEFFENNILTNNFTLNKEKKEVYISKEVATNNLLKVPDIVGNVLEVRIIFYEKMQ